MSIGFMSQLGIDQKYAAENTFTCSVLSIAGGEDSHKLHSTFHVEDSDISIINSHVL